MKTAFEIVSTYDEPAQGLQYDPASQVTQILHQLTATSTPINQAAYAYNPVGNRTSLTDRRGAQTFSYDTLDRLTSASHPLLATPQAFAYDAVGNRTTGGSVVNAGNQLTADTTHSYQYDDNGNLTRKTLLTTGNFTAYTYDAENRLTKVEEFAAGNPTPAFTSTYRYDGLGRRIEKVANGQTKRCPVRLSRRGFWFDSPALFALSEPIFLSRPRLCHRRHAISSAVRPFLRSKPPD